ncbi:hypothetical protein F4678DRAFT_471513 [Xylaria arbuscula]|nr:hypothetical protein F4678DRAFT_471513 [Xylaria arbuscula]
MFSTLLGKRQWDSTWDGLPREIRLLILEALMQTGCTLACLATVSREWQTDLERYNFARIKLTPSRLVNFNVEWEEKFTISNTDNGSIPADPNSELILDISIYSPSDSKHCFRHSAPPTAAIRKVFHSVMGEGPFDSDLLLRQQNRRRWKPGSLAHMFARFPRLQEGLVVFENFNQQYPAIMQRFLLGENLSKCDSIRNPSPAISRMVALASLKLEHLAASFIVDASYFFKIEPSWEWPNLISLVITSKLLAPNENSVKIESILQAAAAAIKMPQLETMEIWNGQKGLAALFKYHAFRDIQQAIITWRGTWELTMEPSAIKAWEAVVIRPISLQQIRIEQKALEGVGTV